jgi:predicted phage baseplate assembly protein
MDSSINPQTGLNDCGCCEGISAETPGSVLNRPGLSAIAYRVGTHAEFKETQLARLSTSGQRALRSLTTRDADDFSIALIDAWSTVADVLTFYQERFANEAYLRTATERLSVLELARLIDYRLRPGVAAGTYLAFTLEDAPGALGQSLAVGTTAQLTASTLPQVTLAPGIKVQSVPGPGEQSQTFETVEEIEASPDWNGIRARLTTLQELPATQSGLDSLKWVLLKGTATEVKIGNRLLLVNEAENRAVKTALSVTVDDEEKTTRVDFAGTVAPRSAPPSRRKSKALPEGTFSNFQSRVELNEGVVGQIINLSWSEGELLSIARVQGWSIDSIAKNIATRPKRQPLAPEKGVFAFRQRAALFGYNAPKQPVYNADGTPKKPSEWEEWDLDEAEAEDQLFLDNAYEAIKPGSYVAIDKPGKATAVFQVEQVELRPRTAYGISSKTTVLTLTESWWTLFSSTPTKLKAFRDVTVYAQSEQLELADLPIEEPVEGNTVTLGRVYLGLKVGQKIILTGERSDLLGSIESEVLTLKDVRIQAGLSVLTFDEQLANSYVRKTVVINANVALSTHGETVQEVLGGGDASQPFQRFTLRQPPLTYVSASNPSGSQSTLEIRVNDLLWQEVPNFYGHEPEERIYVTRTGDDGKTTVIFGDGKTGARLPTGQENVKATYRKGIGLSGLVDRDRLTLLMTKPLGVKAVTNPVEASGADDPEQLKDARANAPLTVLTLGRIVSLRDYQDFARAFSGISKALATWTRFGEKRGVFVTIAGAGGADVKDDSPLHDNLLQAMTGAGDTKVPLLVKSYQQRLFRLSATLSLNAEYLAEKVLVEVEQKLRDAFSFEAREFGQPAHLSEVVAVMQNVSGVIAVNVTEFYRSDQPVECKLHIAASAPSPGDEEELPAELLTLDPRPLALGVMP